MKEPHEPHNWLSASRELYQNDVKMKYVACDGIVPMAMEPSAVIRQVPSQIDRIAAAVATSPILPPVRKPQRPDLPDGCDLAYILDQVMPEIEQRMIIAGQHYGYDTHNDLGLKGQYADMHRKFVVLRRVMWDGEQTSREPLREILTDMIGHALLTISILDRNPEEEG